MANTITIIIAIIGLFGSIISICVSNIYQRKTDLRKIKESQYIDFLSSLAKWKVANNGDKYNYSLILSEKVQTIYLIGNKDVQEALWEFLKLIESKTDKEEQDKLYANLICKMKYDLYGENKKNSSLEEIEFMVFE